MKSYQIILITIAILALNNLVLLTFMGYFSKEKVISTEITTLDAAASLESTKSFPTSSKQPVLSTSQPEISTPLEAQPELIRRFDEYVQSDQFADALENWQLKYRQRYKEINERLAVMNSDELYSIVIDTQNQTERATALYQLMQGGKYQQLTDEQMKSLYSETQIEDWSKSRLLTTLVERGDPEALSWAKQSIRSNSASLANNTGLFDVIYDKDPEFIKQYIANVEFEDSSSSVNLISFIQSESDLSDAYFTRNFDKILDSTNDDVFKYIYAPNIEMTSTQQSRVAELFNSKNRDKRRFAIGLASKITDTTTLRSAYDQLSRSSDKNHFISTLLSDGSNSKNKQLARELAENSNDPSIQQLIKLYGNN